MASERLAGRNGLIWAGYVAGKNQETLAEEHGITRERVSQILAEVRASIPETTKEEIFQRELDFLERLRVEMLADAQAPLPPAFSQRGAILVDDEGNVVRDRSARYAAVDRAMKLHERVSKMVGLDAATKADVTVTDAANEKSKQAAAEAMARLHGAQE
jgi:hypothetical protein